MLARRNAAGLLVLAMVVAVLVPVGSPRAQAQNPAEAANRPQPAADPAAEKTPPAEDNLSSNQEIISRRFKRFEDTLYKIAEIQRKTDPERAELLIRAIGKSKEERISQQMSELIQLLRENKQLGDAISRQDDLMVNLHALLDLLLSEDRQKELKEEQARIKKYIEEVNKIIAKEKAARADTERGAPTDDIAQLQKKIADQAGQLGKQMSREEKAKQARDASRGARTPAEGKESDDGSSGDKSDGDSADGAPSEKSPADSSKPGDKPAGDPKTPDPKNSKPEKTGKPKPGSEKNPADPNPGEKSPSPGGNPPSDSPKPGDMPEGQPADGQPSESPGGEPSPDGQSSSGKSPPAEPPTPGREELEKARRDMERAVEQLKKKQRHAASDAQDDAIANLQKAKEKLEEILKQFREEERERFLAMLEARFQRMLAMQLLVHDATAKLDKTPTEERNDRHVARAVVLARQEEEISLEANKAITVLRDEGTAVAFPEAVEQMRDDMNLVVSRLERTEIGELTQGIQRDIIDALEEMIDALQKEIEKGKDKKNNKQDPSQPSQQAQQDQQLVDQLAELKMLRTLQLRINHRTKRLGRMVDGEQALDDDLLVQLQNLAERQARIQKAAYDMATGRNK
jgi:hypothetical protein